MQETTIHSVTIEQKKSIEVKGVESVLAFSENKITLQITGGEKMFVSGAELKISGFLKSSGTFSASGKIFGISYGGKGFASKFFK